MRSIPAAALLFALVALVAQAQPTADTPGAKHTREKALKTKITLNLDNMPLREIIKELVGAVEDAKGGTIRIKPKENEGITLTSRFTVKAEGQALEDVLDKLLKEKNWGYYVQVGPPGSQDDGAIFLVSKPWRGSPDDEKHSSKKETKDAKTDVGKKEGTKKTDNASADEEKAGKRVDFAENYLAGGKPEKAKPILEDVIKKYPDTKAAVKAKKLLEKIGQ